MPIPPSTTSMTTTRTRCLHSLQMPPERTEGSCVTTRGCPKMQRPSMRQRTAIQDPLLWSSSDQPEHRPTSIALSSVRDLRSGCSPSNLAPATVCFAVHSSTIPSTPCRLRFTRPYRTSAAILPIRAPFCYTAMRFKRWRPQKLRCVVCAFKTNHALYGSTQFASIRTKSTREDIKWA